MKTFLDNMLVKLWFIAGADNFQIIRDGYFLKMKIRDSHLFYIHVYSKYRFCLNFRRKWLQIWCQRRVRKISKNQFVRLFSFQGVFFEPKQAKFERKLKNKNARKTVYIVKIINNSKIARSYLWWIFDFSIEFLGHLEIRSVQYDLKFGFSVFKLGLHPIFSHVSRKLHILKLTALFILPTLYVYLTANKTINLRCD